MFFKKRTKNEIEARREKYWSILAIVIIVGVVLLISFSFSIFSTLKETIDISGMKDEYKMILKILAGIIFIPLIILSVLWEILGESSSSRRKRK